MWIWIRIVWYIWIHRLLGKVQQNIITKERNFYSHLKLKDIDDGDYTHAKRVCNIIFK